MKEPSAGAEFLDQRWFSLAPLGGRHHDGVIVRRLALRKHRNPFLREGLGPGFHLPN